MYTEEVDIPPEVPPSIEPEGPPEQLLIVPETDPVDLPPLDDVVLGNSLGQSGGIMKLVNYY